LGPMFRRLSGVAAGAALLTGALAAGATAASAAPFTSTAPIVRDAEGLSTLIGIDLDDIFCSDLFGWLLCDGADGDDDDVIRPDVPGVGDDHGATTFPEVPAELPDVPADGGDDAAAPAASIVTNIPAVGGVAR